MDKPQLVKSSAIDNPPSVGASDVGGLPVTEDAEHVPIREQSAVNFNLGSHITVESNARSAAFGGFNQSQASGGDGFKI